VQANARALAGSANRFVPVSNLPSGVSQSPKGDIGNHRGREAKAAGAKFKGSKSMDTKKYF
jgi:hypothetical protein